MILEHFYVAATDTDLLSGGRLNAIPYNGKLTLQFLADLADASNFYTVTIQLPNGDVPVDTQRVPASSSGADGVLDDRELLQLSFNATQGGHFVISLAETGTTTCMVRAVLTP
mgnify:CR=1 FL=1